MTKIKFLQESLNLGENTEVSVMLNEHSVSAEVNEDGEFIISDFYNNHFVKKIQTTDKKYAKTVIKEFIRSLS